MTVKEIVEKYLRDNGYEGLCNPDNECGCPLDDLMSCSGEYVGPCEPGYASVIDYGDGPEPVISLKKEEPR